MRTSRTRSWRSFDPSTMQVGGPGTAVRRARPAAAVATEQSPARILGLDPGSRHTGFGIIDCTGIQTFHIASGAISTTDTHFADRLQQIFGRVRELVAEYRPSEIAIERVFVNKNPDSALKLGQARGAALCGAFAATAQIFEYSPREVKMAVVGVGGADKRQVQHMVKTLLALNGRLNADAADALAIALCHIHGRQVRQLMARSS